MFVVSSFGSSFFSTVIDEIVFNFTWFIGIHILATTYHRLKKNGVWSSMVPFFKEYK